MPFLLMPWIGSFGHMFFLEDPGPRIRQKQLPERLVQRIQGEEEAAALKRRMDEETKSLTAVWVPSWVNKPQNET